MTANEWIRSNPVIPQREMSTINISVSLLHHLLATAPYGLLRPTGNGHVDACKCATCRVYQTWKIVR